MFKTCLVDASVREIRPDCTHKRVPGSRLVGAGDADADVARCSVKILFFVTLLATNTGKNKLTARVCVCSQNTVLSYHNNAHSYS